MKVTVALVVCGDDGREEPITDGVILEKTCHQIEQGGRTLAEVQTLLQRLQQHLVERQAAAFVATRPPCQARGALLPSKGDHALTFRTLFGAIRRTSPRSGPRPWPWPSGVRRSLGKRFCKKQQMPWTKCAAHLLLQMRVKTLNDELTSVVRRWYPDFPVQQSAARVA